MNLSVRDIYELPQYSNLNLLAGESGLSNVVTSCGIFDYVFENDSSNKPKQTSFREGQLVLTTLLYAKDNQDNLLHTIINLVCEHCSGLIIKNVFNVDIDSTILSYAEEHDFPIFLIEEELYFENIIVDVSNMIESYNSIQYYEEKTNYLVHSLINNDSLESKAREINPSFNSDIVVIYYHYKSYNFDEIYFDMQKIILDGMPLGIADKAFYYKNGLMIVHTKELFPQVSIDEIIKPFININPDIKDKFDIGVSEIYHNLYDFKKGVLESTNASLLIIDRDKPYHLYQDLGIYQVILPYVKDEVHTQFSEKYLKDIRDYDDQNQTNLFDTIIQFVLSDGDVDRAAESLELHKNTVRYRIEKVSKIIDDNLLHRACYERISMAIRIYLCKEAIQIFKENAIRK